MLRLFPLILSFSMLACSKNQPVPVAPAGKALASLDAPAAPASLYWSVLDSAHSSIRVGWTAVEGATDYDINYKKAQGGRWTNWPHRGAQQMDGYCENTISGLEPETEYRWAVRAENSDGASQWVFGPNFTTWKAPIVEVEPAEPAEIPVEEKLAEHLRFNIDLVFTASFYRSGYSAEDEEIIRYAASRWERLLFDIPDWELDRGWRPGSYSCGDTVTQPTQVDDLTLFIGELPAAWDASALALPHNTRGGILSWGLVLDGCVYLKPGLEGENLAMIVAHEIGHILGFGTTFALPPPIGFEGVLVQNPWGSNPVFTGPFTRCIYQQAGGEGDVPLQPRDGGHWQYPLLRNTLLNPHGNSANPFKITTLDLSAIADLGYPVNMEEATPFELLSASGKRVARVPSWCGICSLKRD